MTKITAFKCDFCNKVFTLSSNTKRHEKTCLANPDKEACRSCLYFEKPYRQLAYCSKLDINLSKHFDFFNQIFPYKANCKLYKKGKKNF